MMGDTLQLTILLSYIPGIISGTAVVLASNVDYCII